MLQSTINDSVYYNSEEDEVERYPKSDQLLATHNSDGKKIKVTYTITTNGNYLQKLLIIRLIPETIPVIILPIDPRIVDGVAASSGTLHSRQTIRSKEIVTDTARSGVRVFRDPTVVNWIDTDRTIPRDGNISRNPPRLTTPVWIGDGPSVLLNRIGIQ